MWPRCWKGGLTCGDPCLSWARAGCSRRARGSRPMPLGVHPQLCDGDDEGHDERQCANRPYDAIGKIRMDTISEHNPAQAHREMTDQACGALHCLRYDYPGHGWSDIPDAGPRRLYRLWATTQAR